MDTNYADQTELMWERESEPTAQQLADEDREWTVAEINARARAYNESL